MSGCAAGLILRRSRSTATSSAIASSRRTTQPTRRAICSTLEENQRFLLATPNYKSTIAASAIDAGQLEAWTTGSWNVQAGGLLEGAWYASSEHFVLDEIPAECIPPTWSIFRGFDWGEAHRAACCGRRSATARRSRSPTANDSRFIRGDFLIFQNCTLCQPGMPNTGTGATIDEIKCEAIEDEIRLGLRYQEHQRQVDRGPCAVALPTT